MIEKNVKQLKQYNLDELMLGSTVQEVNGEIVCYANLQVDKNSGEIIVLSSDVLWAENTISMPVAIKTKDLFDPNGKLLLEPIFEEGRLSDPLKAIIEGSLQAFNESLLNEK